MAQADHRAERLRRQAERESTEDGGATAGELFSTAGVERDRFDAALAGPFEAWLTFLDDSQLAMTRRRCNGPARISGPAGTGKSVVALHRMVRLARRSTGPLLFTTCARTLPPIAKRGFLRLAPELVERVAFWAGCCSSATASSRSTPAAGGSPTPAIPVRGRGEVLRENYRNRSSRRAGTATSAAGSGSSAASALGWSRSPAPGIPSGSANRG